MPQLTVTSIQKSGNVHLVYFEADFVVDNLFYQKSTDNSNWDSAVNVDYFNSPVVLSGLGDSSFFLRLGCDKSIRTNVYGPQYQ